MESAPCRTESLGAITGRASVVLVATSDGEACISASVLNLKLGFARKLLYVQEDRVSLRDSILRSHNLRAYVSCRCAPS